MAVRFESNIEPIPGYRLIDRLGSGGFGEVWRAEAPGGIFKAIKIIHGDLRNKDDDLVRYAEQELKALKRVKTVRHPYLLSIDRFDIVEGRLLIVMELADCNLWDRFRACRQDGLPGIPREELLGYMAEVAEVLDLMNDQFQLQHLDIKPQNLFLLLGHAKVADFGQVKDLQGHMTSVTGGITPVYAAPETFDGFVSRYCDQYSLACVYQELLTGIRPFDGMSMQQLLVQHLQQPPNLDPSPPADRPALARALAKRPEDRFPSVSMLVRCLRDGMDPAPITTNHHTRSSSADHPTITARASGVESLSSGDLWIDEGQPLANNGTNSKTETPLPLAVLDVDTPPLAEAPPEWTGPGPVRPAVLIGIGQTGLRVLQHLRKHLAERYGPPEMLPAIRFLFIDTDPDTLAVATTARPAEGLAGLKPEEVFAARLNRAGHYLKPRLNGRNLVEGWFDTQLLYKLPRTPVTMGLRPLGRLAFCDHYRALAQKLQTELELCTHPDAITDTITRTGLEVRTNRPRVYIVAGLGGATGGGMFLDMAYTARMYLRRLGYADPDVAGVLFVPADSDSEGVSAQAKANAFAALTELHHYTRPETVFQASYDDRYGIVQDPDPPFTVTVILPSPVEPLVSMSRSAATLPGASGRISAAVLNPSGRVGFPPNRSGYVAHPTQRSETVRNATARGQLLSGVVTAPATRPATPPDSLAAATHFLRLDLFTPVGPVLDCARSAAAPDNGPVTVRTFGLVTHDWPRGEVVARTARYVAGVVFDHWVSPNFRRSQEVIPNWAAQELARLKLDPDGLLAQLMAAADAAVGQPLEPLLSRTLETLIPRGWRTKRPSAHAVTLAFAELDNLIGTPLLGANATPTPIEDAIRRAAADLLQAAQSELTTHLPMLADDPTFRLAGAEEAARQVLADLDRALVNFTQQAEQARTDARSAYERLWQWANQSAADKRKWSLTEWTEAVRQYPKCQYRSILYARARKVYEHLKPVLIGVLKEVSACRQRLEGYRKSLIDELEEPSVPIGPRQVMPPGCPTITEAAQKFLAFLSDDDLAGLERQIQATIEETIGGLYQACLNSAEGAKVVLQVVREESRAYLDARLGEIDLAGMLTSRYGSMEGVIRAFSQSFAAATPELVEAGPWARPGITLVATPAGAAYADLRRAAVNAAPLDLPPITADTRDEVVIYREYPHVPLCALPQCGSAWVAAYFEAAEMFQCTPHSRTDITQWVGVDV
jgi:serine/threonine protein kinase